MPGAAKSTSSRSRGRKSPARFGDWLLEQNPDTWGFGKVDEAEAFTERTLTEPKQCSTVWGNRAAWRMSQSPGLRGKRVECIMSPIKHESHRLLKRIMRVHGPEFVEAMRIGVLHIQSNPVAGAFRNAEQAVCVFAAPEGHKMSVVYRGGKMYEEGTGCKRLPKKTAH